MALRRTRKPIIPKEHPKCRILLCFILHVNKSSWLHEGSRCVRVWFAFLHIFVHGFPRSLQQQQTHLSTLQAISNHLPPNTKKQTAPENARPKVHVHHQTPSPSCTALSPAHPSRGPSRRRRRGVQRFRSYAHTWQPIQQRAGSRQKRDALASHVSVPLEMGCATTFGREGSDSDGY